MTYIEYLIYLANICACILLKILNSFIGLTTIFIAIQWQKYIYTVIIEREINVPKKKVYKRVQDPMLKQATKYSHITQKQKQKKQTKKYITNQGKSSYNCGT